MFKIINYCVSKFQDYGLWLLYISGIYTKTANMIVIGLDNAGKTTLIHLLKTNKIKCHEPTKHPNKEEIHIGNITFRAFDLGGHLAARRLWSKYCANVDCIIFIIDTSDCERFDESKKEFTNILMDMPNIPILVLGNKIDKKQTCSKQQLQNFLGVSDSDTNIHINMCSLVKKAGIYEGFKWLNLNL